MQKVGLGLFRFLYFMVYILSLSLGAIFSPKLRRFWIQRLKRSEYSKFSGQPSESLIWLHCSSGEFEYAKPVIKSLKEKNYQTLVTYFSPTYANQVLKFPFVDFAEPLPLDLPGPLQSLIRTYKPKELWIARTDVWPEVLYQCHLAEIPAILFSASKNQKSGGARWLARQGCWLYNQLAKIYVVSNDDEQAFKNLRVRPEVSVLGDTRYDQVRERLAQAVELPLLKHSQPFHVPVLVAGSTWEEDEDVLFKATAELLKSSQLRIILAPHEPTVKHLNSLKSQLVALDLGFDVWSEAKLWTKPILLVDKIGILAEIYTYGDLAFVGGSFKSKVHSVMEPLAAGCPTLIGPKHLNNREAIEFKALPEKPVISCKSAEELKVALENLLSTTHLQTQKSRIQNLVDSRTGATERLILERLETRRTIER